MIDTSLPASRPVIGCPRVPVLFPPRPPCQPMGLGDPPRRDLRVRRLPGGWLPSVSLRSLVKRVAGFLNSGGGTLLIGIGPDREVVGLSHDYASVKQTNGDGFLNWLTTLGHTRSPSLGGGSIRTRAVRSAARQRPTRPVPLRVRLAVVGTTQGDSAVVDVLPTDVTVDSAGSVLVDDIRTAVESSVGGGIGVCPNRCH